MFKANFGVSTDQPFAALILNIVWIIVSENNFVFAWIYLLNI